eukprot:365682-Chlamydomonas_euryale.AAC.22
MVAKAAAAVAATAAAMAAGRIRARMTLQTWHEAKDETEAPQGAAQQLLAIAACNGDRLLVAPLPCSRPFDQPEPAVLKTSDATKLDAPTHMHAPSLH